MKRILYSAFFALACGVAFAEPAWVVGIYDYSTWSSSKYNLLTTEGVEIIDGVTPYVETGKPYVGADYISDAAVGEIVGIAGGTITWLMPNPADIYELKVFTHWGDGGRDGINIGTIEASVDGETWQTLDVPGVYQNSAAGSTGSMYATLSDSEGVALATGVKGLRITFPTQENKGAGYAEIEVIGESLVPEAVIEITEITEYTAKLSAFVKSTGEGADTADLYFAYALSEEDLVPQRIASGLQKGQTYEFELKNLEHGSVYYYTYYLKSAASEAKFELAGSFDTVFDPYRYLPAEYVQVEYIETTGEQCLNTGVKASATVGATIDFMVRNNIANAFLGTGYSDSSDWRFFQAVGSHNAMFDVGNTRLTSSARLQTVGVRYKVELGNYYFRIYNDQGSLVSDCSSTAVDGSAISSYNIFLSACGRTDTEISDYAKMRTYSLVMTDGGEVVRDFVPCSNTVDKCYGFYDVKNEEFYNLSGSNFEALIIGAEVPCLKYPTIEGTVILLR